VTLAVASIPHVWTKSENLAANPRIAGVTTAQAIVKETA